MGCAPTTRPRRTTRYSTPSPKSKPSSTSRPHPAELLQRLDPEAIKNLPEGPLRDKVTDALREITRIRERNPLAGFLPYPKQRAFLRQAGNVDVAMFIAGNQTGKTTIGLVDDLIQACDLQAIPEHLRQYKKFDPPFYARLMTPDFTATMEQVLMPKLRALAPKDQLAGGSWSRAYDKKNRVLRFANGSWFQFMTYEQDRDKLGGATLHRIHYDEEPPSEHRGESRIRTVRHSRGHEIFTMTPLDGLTWTFDELWTPWEEHWGERRVDRDDLTPVAFADDFDGTTVEQTLFIQQASMTDNPYLSTEAIARTLAGESPEMKEARMHGRFVHLHGLIYGDFKDAYWPEGNKLKATALPDNVNVVVGIDPGHRYAAGVVWVAIDHRGTMIVFDELKLPRMNVADVAEAIHINNARWEITPAYYVIDPAARNKTHHTGRSDQLEYADHGIRAMPGQNDVKTGILRMKGKLAERTLLIYDTCTELLWERKRYRWKDPPITLEETREAPVKKDDHLLDALRYVVMSRPYAPRKVEPEKYEAPLDKAARLDRERLAQREPMHEFGALYQ